MARYFVELGYCALLFVERTWRLVLVYHGTRVAPSWALHYHDSVLVAGAALPRVFYSVSDTQSSLGAVFRIQVRLSAGFIIG